ncbi:MAG: lipocalin family protein [Pseudomonadota bacterium]
MIWQARQRRGVALSAILVVALAAGATAVAEVGTDDRAGTGDVAPVTGFDLARYLGTWHEIAAIPTWFQEDCAASTSASYAMAEDVAGITVTNSCVEADGSLSQALGRARFTGPDDQGGLEVTFLSLLGYWLWPIAGEYVVIALDPDYQWTAVGHPSREYGWILAREERIDTEMLAEIAAAYAAAGYDTCTLLMSPRAVGDPRTPLCEVVAAAAPDAASN